MVSENESYDYEIIAVNDCSPDQVWTKLISIADGDPKFKAINLVRNCGKNIAILAGYHFIHGDYVVNIDDDYQCPVNELWKLLGPVESGQYDVATAQYAVKKESWWKVLGSRINASVARNLLDMPKELFFENFVVMKRFVADEMRSYINPYPYFEGLILKVTKKIAMVPMQERERGDDQGTGFTFRKSFSMFANGLTAFSVKPLRISTVLGSVFALAGFIWMVVIIIRKLISPAEIMEGYSSIMAIILFSSGCIMLMLGLIGEYLGRIYISINHYPQYTVRETRNINEE